MLSRRAVLAGGTLTLAAAGAVAVEEGVLPGRARARQWLGLNGPAGVVPDVPPATMEFGSFVSRARGGAETGYAIITPVVPGGGDPHAWPVVVALHQRGGSHRSLAGGSMHLERFLQAHVEAGGSPFVIATADGAEDYWHRRPDGTDPGRMITDELLPLLAQRDLRAGPQDQIGLIGWSMGGYGVLHLAGVLRAAKIRAAVAVSPSLWEDGDDASEAGFVDAEEYAEFNAFGRQDELDGIAVRLDCGKGDIFFEFVESYVRDLPPSADVNFEAGGHDLGYWLRVLPSQLAFLGAAWSEA